jgi:hypothetical protein
MWQLLCVGTRPSCLSYVVTDHECAGLQHSLGLVTTCCSANCFLHLVAQHLLRLPIEHLPLHARLQCVVFYKLAALFVDNCLFVGNQVSMQDGMGCTASAAQYQCLSAI